MNDDFLICYRARGYRPRVKSFQAGCCKCGERVWRACSSPPEARAICMQCAARQIKEGDIIMGPSPEQTKDMEEYFKQKDASNSSKIHARDWDPR